MMDANLRMDMHRYPSGKMPRFQLFFRLSQSTRFRPLRLLYKALFVYYKNKNLIEISSSAKIGGGLYIGHPYAITINPGVIMGENINIHKGVTIGQENRGSRKGTPIIEDFVWIGVNATIVGSIKIGSDTLIAPNAYVNQDIPPHSVVYGNPCQIRHNEFATKDYINYSA